MWKKSRLGTPPAGTVRKVADEALAFQADNVGTSLVTPLLSNRPFPVQQEQTRVIELDFSHSWWAGWAFCPYGFGHVGFCFWELATHSHSLFLPLPHFEQPPAFKPATRWDMQLQLLFLRHVPVDCVMGIWGSFSVFHSPPHP